jgi:protein gp37
MADKTAIQWTEATWNPTAGCSIVSPGCRDCYAMEQAHSLEKRFGAGKYSGLTKVVNGHPVWTGEIRMHEAALLQPLKWAKPRRIFVNSMSDLFHEGLTDGDIIRVFGVMALCPQHSFQVLTKRADRMREFLSDRLTPSYVSAAALSMVPGREWKQSPAWDMRWPLPNVWMGISAERQKEADERIPQLLQTPAALRFVSAEPLLGPINFESWLPWPEDAPEVDGASWGCQECESDCRNCPNDKAVYICTEGPTDTDGAPEWVREERRTLSWIIVGGESGQNARPFDIGWAKSIVSQCSAAQVACFVKQIGSNPVIGGIEVSTIVGERYPKHKKGGDPEEWHTDIRVRQMPSLAPISEEEKPYRCDRTLDMFEAA